MGADAVPRDSAWIVRWGAHLLYLGAIAILYLNSTPALFVDFWQLVLQAVLVAFVIAAVVLRVRLPYALPLLGLVGMVSGTFSVFIVGMLSLAVRRAGLRVWLVGLAGSALSAAIIVRRDLEDGMPPGGIAVGIVMSIVIASLAPILVGGYIRAHRRLQTTVAERAVRAEFERELAARQAVHTERERIAREMHDSLGHVLALVTMQAGALEVSARDPETASAAEGIRSSARSGLAELRAVVRALGEDARRDPSPGLSAVPRLVEASRDAGAEVRFDDGISPAEREALPHSTGRIVYQVVQEALTNAHRHAPGAPVDIALSAAPGAGVEVVARNALAPGGERGAGTGLDALRGRVAVLGGALDAHAARGRFELRVRIPWEAGV